MGPGERGELRPRPLPWRPRGVGRTLVEMVNPRDLVSTLELDRVGGDRVYFVSDIHLGDGSHADIFLEKDEHFLDFLDEVVASAAAARQAVGE